MKRIACVSIIFILVLSILPGMVSSQDPEVVDQSSSPGKEEPIPLDQYGPIAIDGTDLFWVYQHVFSKLYPGLIGEELAQALNPYQIDSAPDNVGDTANFWMLSGPDPDSMDTWISVPSTCRAVGDYCYVYVEDAEWGTHITQTEVNEIMNTFDDIIYPVESENFRELPDYKGQDKVTIFLSDIQDGWTGVAPYNIYIAGYFHSLNYTDDTHSNDRHMINIDTYPGIYYQGVPDTSHALGVVAHEYQHLLHFWSDPDETTWLNEGQSDYAEFLTLGILEESHLAYFYAFHSCNLEMWGSGDANVLESYGASLSFMMYLYENFGGPAIMSAIHNDPLNGRSSIDAQVNGASFDNIYTDWTLANLLDLPSIPGPNSGAGLGFNSYDIGSSDTWYYTVTNYYFGWPDPYVGPYWFNWDWGPYPYADPAPGFFQNPGYPSPDAGYWQDTQQQLDANYFIYEESIPSFFDISFLSPLEYQMAVPSVGALEWYSMMGNGWYDGAEHTLCKTLDLTGQTGTTLLNIDTWADIEYGWDFGYVEVSTDGGTNWTQLQDLDAVMDDYRDPDAVVGYDGSYAFTGYNMGWKYDVTFDLSTYNGESSLMVRFSYFTDDYVAGRGWVVDNIRLTNDGATILGIDGSDASDATWTSNGWVHTDTKSPLYWSLYCVGIPYNGPPSMNDIYEVPINPNTGSGQLQIPGLGSVYREIVVVPSVISDESVGGHHPYLHRGEIGYSPPGSRAFAATFPLFKNAQNKVVTELEGALSLYEEAEAAGHDVSEFDPLFDSVNSLVAEANTGINWIFRAGKLLDAAETLAEIIEGLENLMG